jgi:hypothetical protein
MFAIRGGAHFHHRQHARSWEQLLIEAPPPGNAGNKEKFVCRAGTSRNGGFMLGFSGCDARPGLHRMGSAPQGIGTRVLRKIGRH